MSLYRFDLSWVYGIGQSPSHKRLLEPDRRDGGNGMGQGDRLRTAPEQSEINRAIGHAKRGDTIKPALRISRA